MDLILTTRYLDDLAGLGVTIPAESDNARRIYNEALAAAAVHPVDTLREAFAAGEITPDNVAAAVRQAAADMTAQQNAHAIVSSLSTALNKAIRDGLRSHFDQIHADLAATFSPAADEVMKAARHFGPDTSADEVLTMRPEAIKAWKQVGAAATTLDAVSRAYRSLLVDVMADRHDQPVTLFVTGSEVNVDQAAETYRVSGSWLALAHAGFRLKLNTPTEARSIERQWEQVKAKAVAAEREIELAAHRRKYMPLGIR